MKNKKEYHVGNLKHFTATIAQIFKIDLVQLRATLKHNFPAIADQSQCPHCGASMEMKVYSADMHTGLLILRMAEKVRQNMKDGMPFTEANRVHVPTLETTDSIRHHVTIASYLGLVHQPEDWKASGFWLLTGWGWQALRGEQVPKWAKYFRGQLIERSPEKTTLSEMFRAYSERIEQAVKRGKAIRSDHRASVKDFDPIQWTEFGGYAKGNLFE